MLNFSKKPTIKAQLIKNETQSAISFENINKQQSLILLYYIVNQLSKSLEMDFQELCLRIAKLDKTIKKEKKEKKKA